MSVPLKLRADHLDSGNVHIRAAFAHKDQSIQTPPVTLPYLVRTIGGVAAVESMQDQDDRRVLIENDFFRVTVAHKGGDMRIRSKAGWTHNMYLNETIGPAFFPREFGKKSFDLTFTQNGSTVAVITTIVSENFPGLEMRRDVIITAAPVIQVGYRLRHTGSADAASHTCQIMTYNRLLNLGVTDGLSTIPLENRMTQSLATSMPSVDDDFPQKPDGVGEEWAAYSSDGQAHGLIWSPTVAEHEWKRWGFSLYSAEQTLAPQQAKTLDPFYLYCGPGDWRDIRRIWQSIRGDQATPRNLREFDNCAMPTAAPPHRVRLLPDPLITLADEVEATLHAENVRPVKLNGSITLELPDGWSSDVADMNGLRIDVSDLATKNELTRAIKLTAPSRVGASVGQLRLSTQIANETTPIALLRLGDATRQVTLSEQTTADHQLWQVANGHMVYTVAPSFHAGIVEWRKQTNDVNHLHTSFPDEGDFEWMKPWFGGVRPTLSCTDSNWPGKLHEVNFTTSAIDAIDQQNLPWQGVRLDGKPVEESTQGIRIQLDYLTLPGSNVLKLVFRVINNTPVYRKAELAWPGFGIYCQTDGNVANGTLHADSPYVGEIQRKRSEQNTDFVVDNWAAVENPETGRAIVVVSGERAHQLEINDADKKGGHFYVGHGQDLPPNGQHEMVTYLALTESVEEAKRYAVLTAPGN
ncbi:hypothetical protein KFU94_06070 [Chloroflexi bacterium TSY]|nr:hypothetical protein [Chloroflexi bacterium TSY]